MFGKWGSTPTPTTTATTAPADISPPAAPAKASVTKPASPGADLPEVDKKDVVEPAETKKPRPKPAGINHEGTKKGFMPTVSRPTLATEAPVLNSLDEEALRNVLAGG